MTEGIESLPEPLARAETESKTTATLTMEDLHRVFLRAAQLDSSGDEPELTSSFSAQIENGALKVVAPYMLHGEKWRGQEITIKGQASNGPEGSLADNAGINVEPESFKQIVVEAYGGRSDFPNFLQITIQDALEGKGSVQRMWLVDDKLVVTLEKTTYETPAPI